MFVYIVSISFAAILQLILSTVLLSLAVVLSQCCLIFTSNISIYLLYIYVYKYTYIYIYREREYVLNTLKNIIHHTYNIRD